MQKRSAQVDHQARGVMSLVGVIPSRLVVG